ncbi:CoA transferase subunit A [Ectothiorhodospira lacustris]|uniref:CoA transferase subunit A n=1 Tax=Ectothiorhodospira lacustris TaxID=2899127 RepID=UPI001EE999E4|nr:CoA transferase [Ectothiorhodospira lacustris]MCG5501342.1 hypothetical protein [Ectothiorhodospira lacustris]
MSVSKLVSLRAAVRRFAFNGMQYASGAALPIGADALVFGSEMIRQGIGDIHLVSHCASQQMNLLVAAGAVKSIETGFTGLEVFGFAQGLRRKVESGQVRLEDYSNLTMPLRYLAAALGLPFMPTRVNIGSDLQYWNGQDAAALDGNEKIPLIGDPFQEGGRVGALRPLAPDLAAIHVTLADPQGNGIMIGSEWSRWELARAAKRVVLIADHIVDTACMRQFPNLVRIPSALTDAVVCWPLSAWPQSSPGVHDVDEAQMRAMNQALGNDADTRNFLGTFVFGWDSHADFMALIGSARSEALRRTETAFLLDPYRQWFLSDRQITELTQAD